MTSKNTLSSDKRKLKNMLEDLKKIKIDLCPEDEKEKNQNALKLKIKTSQRDAFVRKQEELSELLQELNAKVEHLQEVRKNVGRCASSIQLASENSTKLKEATDMFTHLKSLLAKQLQKNKVKPQELKDRQEMIRLMGVELQRLVENNSNVKINRSDAEIRMEQRVELQRQARTQRARQKRNNNPRQSDLDKIDGLALVEEGNESKQTSIQEMTFMDTVSVNIDKQDILFDEISKGLDDLKEMSTDINKKLTKQAYLLGEVDNKIDEQVQHFKTANKRMKALLAQSGGMSRIIPILICCVFLLALLGYTFHMI
jgi:hypothetical protein